jgi:hypothetical protein
MKKVLYSIFFIAAIAFVSCSKEKDVYSPELAVEEEEDDFDANVHATGVFGVKFSANQTWSAITSGSIEVVADAELADIVKVQILTESPIGNENARVLNEAKVEKGQSCKLTFDAPSKYTRLYAACVDSKGVYYFKGFNVGESSVSFAKPAATRSAVARKLPAVETIVLGAPRPSYNNQRTQHADENSSISMFKNSGWQNEYLWQLDSESTETSLKQDIDDFSEDEKADIEAMFTGYLSREKGRYQRNLEKIRNSRIFSVENNYLTSTEDGPIVLTPVMFASTEINDCDIYYYYFNPKAVEGMDEAAQIQYMKDLPKFKAVQCNRTGFNGNTVFRKHTYTLMYFGDDAPETGKHAVTYEFPKGYKIGFMCRKHKNGQDNYLGVQNGCGYGDGRLNAQINSFGHFKSAQLTSTDPRIVMFGANGNTYMAFEDGTDQQFSDAIIEVSGGVMKIDEPEDVSVNVYTFCFEDRREADYDLNDVVVKAERIDMNHVKFSLVACGANDEIMLRNINGIRLNGNQEIHAMFGTTPKQFINTTGGEYFEPIVDTLFVNADYSLADPAKQLYIYDKNTGSDIRLATKGQDPHAILIPWDFEYPLERVCIKDAYLEFNNWGQDPISSTDWYMHPTAGKVYQHR